MGDLFPKGLLDAAKQYIRDALPGGVLNAEVTNQGLLDAAAIATIPAPILGDAIGFAADLHRYKNEPESRTPFNFALTGLGLLPFVPGMIAYHGSPHKFTKFDMSKIGTGEGAQAYGHGLYVAELPEVAKEYSKLNPTATVPPNRIFQGVELVPGTPEYHAGTLLERSTLPAARKEVAGWIAEGHPDQKVLEGWKKTLDTLNKATKKSDFKVGKNENLYKVDIPDEAVARFLDWDKPLSQQAPEVQKALQRAAEIRARQTGGAFGPLDMGQAGKDVVPSMGEGRLKQSGIHGIRYLDGGSRGAGQGSSNFVLFDDQLPRILEINGQPTGLLPWKPGEWQGLLSRNIPEPPRAEAMRIAQRNAAKPISEGGLGLRPDNMPMERAKAMAGLTKEDAISRAHEVGNLEFTNIPISEFNGKLIYKSPSYNRQQSSEYRLGEINGNPVYMRKANHWGNFGTNIKEGDKVHSAFSDILGETEDVFGRSGSMSNNWAIDGDITNKLAEIAAARKGIEPFSPEWEALWDKAYPLMKKSRAGYINIDDLVGRIPEKIARFDTFDAPIVTLSNGNIRSRFAAFDPARRNEADLLGQVRPDLLPWLMGAGLLGAGGVGLLDQ